MPLTPGSKLGPYEIISPLGAGGMGEVFRARDARLGRDVAIKSLPDDFSQDTERLARFEREARLLAALNHPNIAGIHGLEDVDGARYLVLEFVDGETLAERIARGALPLDETVAIATQIATGLEAAHENGVIHRDLKPGNIIITPAGQAKILDFGLATSGAAGATGSNPNLSHSPTVTNQATRAGVILGTAAYMSPEQARGRVVDRRTDIWSFGCVLYECLTGKQLYEGETVSDLIARILERDPDWNALPANTPPRLRELLKRCLRKDAKERLRDMGDARLELEAIGRGEAAPAAATAAAAGGRRWMWFALPVVAIVAAVVTALIMNGRGSGPAAAYEFTLVPPPGYTFVLPASPALSPDGQNVACCVADTTGTTFLAVRRLDREEFRVLPGTLGATYPFWSPDSRSIAFFNQTHLVRMALDGSTPVALADAPDGRWGSWADDGTIIFVPTASGPCFRMPSTGGRATQITTLDAARHEVGHRYPVFLHDQKHFLYVALCRDGKKWLCVGDVDGSESRALRTVQNCSRPAVPGWVATVENRKLMVQRFDEKALNLEGDPQEIAQSGSWPKFGDPNLAADTRGTIVYQRELVRSGWLRWYDVASQGAGPRLRVLDTPTEVVLAPDRRHVAVTMGTENDLWLVDLEQPVPTRLTFYQPQMGALGTMRWSADSKRIAYTLSTTTSSDAVHVYSTATSTDTTLFRAPGMFASSAGWTPDGKYLAITSRDTTLKLYTKYQPYDDPGSAARCLNTPEYEVFGSVSPNGSWQVLGATGGGKSRVEIFSFPRANSRFEPIIDTEIKSEEPVQWSVDGRTIIVQDVRGRVLAVPVSLDNGFRQGEPRVLFTLGPQQVLCMQTSDLKRFLILELERLPNPAPLRVLTHWPQRIATH